MAGVLTMCLIEIHVDPFKLEVAVSLIEACSGESMFLTDHLPELFVEEENNTILLSTTAKELARAIY